MCLGTSMLTSLVFDLMRGWLEKGHNRYRHDGACLWPQNSGGWGRKILNSRPLGQHSKTLSQKTKPEQAKTEPKTASSVSCHAGCNCDVTHSVLVGHHPCPLWQSVLSVPRAMSLKHKFRVWMKMEEMESCRNVHLKELGIFHRA